VKKIRADLLLVQQGLAPSRAQAQALILAGEVFCLPQRQRIEKASFLLEPSVLLEVRRRIAYVGRGGLKLEHALNVFQLDPTGWTVLDAGASTGGFTDCLLQRGARKVFAVDVGYGQFHWKLRDDPRVVLLEKTNIRNLATISEACDLIVADLSFISLAKVLPKLVGFLKPNGQAVLLVKPQFELSPRDAKKGVVRSPELHARAVHSNHNRTLSWTGHIALLDKNYRDYETVAMKNSLR